MDTKDVTDSLSKMSATEIAGGAIGFSLLAALSTMGVLHLRQRLGRARTAAPSPLPGAGTPSPVEPMGDAVMAAEVPHHFSEGLVVPGFTETGADIERQDDRYGRSPEGV
ncbi:MAG TPA: hypothetical protein VFB58_12870 [Chloroflexota bacterium]|nr:hypothetical protein [Chloroflexota bacterium]